MTLYPFLSPLWHPAAPMNRIESSALVEVRLLHFGSVAIPYPHMLAASRIKRSSHRLKTSLL